MIALLVYGVLPQFGAPTTLSANEVLMRSLQTLSSGQGVEMLEYEVTMDGMTGGPVVIRQVIDRDNPHRYKVASYHSDGTIASAVSQDPTTQRRSQLFRVDGTNYIVRVGRFTRRCCLDPADGTSHGRNQHRHHAGEVGSATDRGRRPDWPAIHRRDPASDAKRRPRPLSISTARGR